MSQTYVELYQNKIKYQNKILSDNKENISRNQKIISLIKKFPVKQRKTFTLEMMRVFYVLNITEAQLINQQFL